MDSIAHFLYGSEVNKSSLESPLEKTDGNIMDLSDESFVKNFRLNKEAFTYVLGLLKNELPKTSKSFAVSPQHQLAVCLQFFAEGSYQHGAGEDFDICIGQPTFSIILSRVLDILEKVLCPRWIKSNGPKEQKRASKQYFYGSCRIPGVVMCVDGTHIAIKAPNNNPHLYYNRKGFHSINAMIICDEKLWIRCIDARFPGSNSDSSVWNKSNASSYFKQEYERGDRNTRLLGDSGYPLQPWLLTPYRSVKPYSRESKFNKHHSKGINTVERTIRVLKNRFRCLMSSRVLQYEPKIASQIVNVCCALHNICMFFKVGPIEENIEENDVESQQGYESEEFAPYEAIRIRDKIMESL